MWYNGAWRSSLSIIKFRRVGARFLIIFIKLRRLESIICRRPGLTSAIIDVGAPTPLDVDASAPSDFGAPISSDVDSAPVHNNEVGVKHGQQRRGMQEWS